MKRSVTGFRGERLSQALDVRRLTQVQLASMVGVSPATVSKWRNNQQNPDPETLERLATIINVTPEWFLRGVPELSSSPVLARSNASALVAARALMRARHDWSKEMALQLVEHIEFPEPDFPVFPFVDHAEISNEDIERAATACRTRWKLGLGPITDVVLAIENAGGIVVREVTGVGQIEGLSSWSAGKERPFVFLSADKENGIRSRFDAAHELGHIVMHKHVPDTASSSVYKEMERQAHRFAGAFLLPAESFAAEIRSVPTLDTLLALKSRWKVSVAAMIMRLHALGLIDDGEKLNLLKRKSARFGSKAEPKDDLFAPEQARLLKRAITLLVDSGTVPRTEMRGLFGFSNGDIEMLAGLPRDYLSPTEAAVIDLNAVRLRRA